jgi:hypothetical protein
MIDEKEIAVASSVETRVFGLSRIRDGIARFVSRIRTSWVWYDTHLPLVPQPVRVERHSIRGTTEDHGGGRR